MCLPHELAVTYKENPKWPNCYEMGYSAPIYRNMSDIFYAEVSVAGTVLPQLIRRQPVAQIARSHPVLKMPQYAEMKIQESESLLAAIIAQLNRGEIHQFTKYFNEAPLQNLDFDITRFRPFTRQMENNIDIASYGSQIFSIEDIMINEPLVDGFYGKQYCEFCPVLLEIQNETTYMTHLTECHTSLLKAHFTCPACLIPAVFSAKDYESHYAYAHAGTAGLMFVLNETNVHVRVQHAHLLNLFLLTAKKLNFTPEVKESDQYVSAIGGYTISEPANLVLEIMDLQQNSVPRGFYKPDTGRYSTARRYSRSPSPPWSTVFKKTEKNKDTVAPRLSQRLHEENKQESVPRYTNRTKKSAWEQNTYEEEESEAYEEQTYRPTSMNEFPMLQREERSRRRRYSIPPSKESARDNTQSRANQ